MKAHLNRHQSRRQACLASYCLSHQFTADKRHFRSTDHQRLTCQECLPQVGYHLANCNCLSREGRRGGSTLVITQFS